MSESESDSEPSQLTKTFTYNVRWMTSTFNTHAQVESLLGPQQAAGNISSHDYDAAMTFLPGYHRFYGLILSSAALSLIYIFRRPTWSQRKLAFLAGGGAFSSLTLGNALTLKSHYDFVRSLNNPGGFSTALDHIQKKNGTPLPNSPIINRKYKREEGLHGNIEDRLDFIPPELDAEPPVQPQSPQTQVTGSAITSSSKWDQIRAANAARTTSSSWDALRQKHEKSRATGSTTPEQKTNDPADDRAAEQARFDALLEKERMLGSQELRE